MSVSRDMPNRTRAEALHAIAHDPDIVARKNRLIYGAMLERSDNIDRANFTALGPNDLRLLFSLYDTEFFDHLLGRMLDEDGVEELFLRPSNRLTRSAGITGFLRRKVPTPQGIVEKPEYEIAISSFLLFENFRDEGREVTVGGLLCKDRLEALQRIFEHELLHLAEFLAWGRSSCSASNFHALSQRIFGHAGTTHALVTPRQIAAEVYQLRIGDIVSFEHEGIRRIGRVNRITKRVTVLVEDAAGVAYSDGRKYATFYVPMPLIQREAGRQ
jgi:hypothetical protein